MVMRHWEPKALVTAQESRATPANVETGDIFVLLVSGRPMATFTATAPNVGNVCTGLAAAWNASIHPYASIVTASDEGTYVELLADNPGCPFVVTSSTTDGGGNDNQTLTITTPVPNDGPNVFDSADNWSDEVAPSGWGPTDVVDIGDSSTNICWGLDQAAVDISVLRIFSTYTGRIGLLHSAFATSIDGETTDADVPEYRQEFLKLDIDELYIGTHYGPAASSSFTRLCIDNTNTGTWLAVVDKVLSASADPLLPTVRLLSNSANGTIWINSASGGVGLGVEPAGATSVIGTVNMAGIANTGTCYIGEGVTLGTFKQRSGTSRVGASGGTIDLIDIQGGTLWVTGGAIITEVKNGENTSENVNQGGGTLYLWNVTGSDPDIVDLWLRGGHTFGLGEDRARTWGNLHLKPRAKLTYDKNVITIANEYDEQRGG